MKIFLAIILTLQLAFFTFIFPALAESEGEGKSTSVSLEDVNPIKRLSKDAQIPDLIGRVIQAMLGLVGSIALVMFIYGGIVWMTSQGNDQKVKQGKDILIWATLGLVVIFTSYALTKFVIEAITKT
jgi:hypothetical protein